MPKQIPKVAKFIFSGEKILFILLGLKDLFPIPIPSPKDEKQWRTAFSQQKYTDRQTDKF